MKTFEVAFDFKFFIPAVGALQNFSNSNLSQFAKLTIYVLLNM